MKNSTIYILILVVFSISCKRDCHETGTCDPEYYRFELGEAKDNLWAGKGSYWIYKNTKTGDLDTQVCTSAKTYWIKKQGSTEYSKNITFEYEVLLRNISSSFNDWVYIDETSFYNPDALRSKKNRIGTNSNWRGDKPSISTSICFKR